MDQSHIAILPSCYYGFRAVCGLVFLLIGRSVSWKYTCFCLLLTSSLGTHFLRSQTRSGLVTAAFCQADSSFPCSKKPTFPKKSLFGVHLSATRVWNSGFFTRDLDFIEKSRSVRCRVLRPSRCLAVSALCASRPLFISSL